MIKTCLICNNTNLQHQSFIEYGFSMKYDMNHCFHCYDNHHIISYFEEKHTSGLIIDRNNCFIELKKLTQVNNNETVEDLNHFDRCALTIDDNIYIAIDDYVVYFHEPKSIYITKNLPIDYDPSYGCDYYELNTNIIDIIKSSKNPEDAINSINTLLLFN